MGQGPDLSPRLSDIRIKPDMFLDSGVMCLEHEALGILMRLVWMSAASRVWTYTPPDPNGWLPCDDDKIIRLACCTKEQWVRHKPRLMDFFVVRGEQFKLAEDWISIGGGGSLRPAISADLRAKVLKRDGHRCSYCGSTSGPFDLDHIVPIAQGGSTAKANLTVACAPCNRSKGARTPEEWLA